MIILEKLWLIRNQRKKEIDENFNGFVILKDKNNCEKNTAVVGTATYKYSEVLNQMGFTKFDKQSLVQYAKGTQMTSLYIKCILLLCLFMLLLCIS